ncbi:MAG: hypothetical protein RIT19_2946 [Verrucomicrobiota bacterium]
MAVTDPRSRLETFRRCGHPPTVSSRRAIVAVLLGLLTLRVAWGGPSVGFESMVPESIGVAFTNRVPDSRYLTNQVPLNGSGVALGDVDGDGRPEIFLAAYSGGSALFRNLGNWRFDRVTAKVFEADALSGLDATGAVLADIDGDDDLDLLLNTLGQGTRIFVNDGSGRFAAGAVLNPRRAGSSLSLADADGDGDLDLYVANYRTVTVRDDPRAKYSILEENGRQRIVAYNGRSTDEPDLVGRFTMTPAGPRENGEADAMYLNDGKGGFAEVPWTGGAFLGASGRPLDSAPQDWGLSVLFRDLTGDGRPDLYVCNDFHSEDRFWINETPPGGPLRFRAAAPSALRHTSAFSMGVDAADIDRDGIDDFIVLDMLSREHRRRNTQMDGVPPGFYQPGIWDDRPQFSHNTLFLGRGDGTFAEIGRLAGVSASEWSWTPIFLDVDLDGFEDLLVSNGHEMDMLDVDVAARAETMKSGRAMGQREMLEMRRMFARLDTPNAAFRNRGDLTFEDVTRAWGFDAPGVEQGMAAADLDGDGDLDLVLNTLNGPAKVYRNKASAPRLAVRLRGAGGNSRGIGARIRSTVRGLPVQSQEMMAGGRYLSGDDHLRTFALGTADTADIEVTWRNGRVTRRSGVGPGVVEVREDRIEAAAVPVPTVPLFESVSGRLGHVHADTPFDEFGRQPLKPFDLAQVGPGVTWADVNADGWDDLLVSAGQGGSLSVFTNDARGGFSALTIPALLKPVSRDLTTVLVLRGMILAGISNAEDGATNGGAIRIVDPVSGVSGEVLSGRACPVGSMAAADVDGDGELEILVGVREVPGRYPEPATSFLVRNRGGRLGIQSSLEKLGLVHGVVFTDLDDDARPDLAVGTSWGPVRLFRNRSGTLEPWDPPLRGAGLPKAVERLSDWTGLWLGITAGDFDGDGRMDLAAGNWGRNHFHGAEAAHRPLRIRHGDLQGDGIWDVLESYVGADGRDWPVRKRPALAGLNPDAARRFPDADSFGKASMEDLWGPVWKTLPGVSALNLDSGVFLNRGDHLEWRAFPPRAQVAPAHGLAVADFDGDGTEDVVLSQNHFGIHSDDARYDAGRGLLLKGSGRGVFQADERSGIVAWGDQRGVAVADLDADGRADLAVGQNSGPTLLFRNLSARPGLRVRLKGPPANPAGIGASLRWCAAGKAGPRREIRMGGGCCSVDSPVTVLASDRGAGEVEVRWPGGAVRRVPVAAGVAEITLTP